MSILDSQIAPYIFTLAIFAVLAGFFRKLLLKVVVILLVEAVFFALFPQFLQHFVDLIITLRHAI